MSQVAILVRELCRLHGVSEPEEVEKLNVGGVWVAVDPAPDSQDMDDDDDDDDNDDDEDLHLEMDDSEVHAKNKVRYYKPYIK